MYIAYMYSMVCPRNISRNIITDVTVTQLTEHGTDIDSSNLCEYYFLSIYVCIELTTSVVTVVALRILIPGPYSL